MRPLLLSFLLATSLLLPLASAESRTNVGAGAGGATLGLRTGVTGAQADDHTAIGLRYWQNATAGQGVSMILTVCVVFDTGRGYCEPLRIRV